MQRTNVPVTVDPATIMERLCTSQRRVCQEFIKTTNDEVFGRVVELVNRIVHAGIQQDNYTLEQAVYKIALLAQAQTQHPSPVTEHNYAVAWLKKAYVCTQGQTHAGSLFEQHLRVLDATRYEEYLRIVNADPIDLSPEPVAQPQPHLPIDVRPYMKPRPKKGQKLRLSRASKMAEAAD